MIIQNSEFYLCVIKLSCNFVFLKCYLLFQTLPKCLRAAIKILLVSTINNLQNFQL